jgi:hypothetical protein
MRAGWVVEAGTNEPRAHQLGPRADGEALGTLCGIFAGPEHWEPAEPGVERCQGCQLAAAGPHPD